MRRRTPELDMQLVRPFAALYSDGHCPTCVARQRVHDLLSNEQGEVHQQLRPLIDLLDIDGNPRSVIAWLHRAKWAEQLGELARQHHQITHQIIDDLPQTRHLAYLRQVLVHIGALAARDEDIDGTMPWLDDLLEDQPTSITSVVRPYATWSVLRRARRRRNHTNNRSARKYARSRISLATQFLNWLDSRGKSLSTANQADIEAWLVEGSTSRHRLRDFLLWAGGHGLSTSLEIPWLGRDEPEAFLARESRWDLLRRCMHEEAVAAHLRAAGGMVLLYGLTPTRIVQIRTTDIDARDGHTYLNLGRYPMILPGGLATLVAEVAADAAQHEHPLVGSSGRPDRWLFPGAAPGCHARASWIAQQLNQELGIFVRAARNTALCTLAEDLPAPILADLLGMHITTAVRWTKLVKRDWTHYLAERVTPTVPVGH